MNDVNNVVVQNKGGSAQGGRSQLIYREQNSEVLYSEDDITTVCQEDIDGFIDRASYNPRKRIRLCAHHQKEAALHEMLIVHSKNAYVRPHKHLGKTESMHIIQGLVDVVLFDDDGGIERVMSMGDSLSGKMFYYRMEVPAIHTLIVRSNVLVFHETTNGPFDKDTCFFPSWAPDEADVDAVASFMLNLNSSLSRVRVGE